MRPIPRTMFAVSLLLAGSACVNILGDFDFKGKTAGSGGTGGVVTTSSTGGMGATMSTAGTGGMITTSSTAGTGGMVTTSSMAGTSSTTTGSPCTVAADCAGQDTDCQLRTCANGKCGFSYAPYQTIVPTQTPGDCKNDVCDGTGGIVKVANPADKPLPTTTCVTPSCNGATPVLTPLARGTTCNDSGGVLCSGHGACVPRCVVTVPLPPSSGVVYAAVADVDGDMKPDLVVAERDVSKVSVLINRGNAVFADPVDYAVGAHPRVLALGKLNDDNKLDIAVANFDGNNVSVLINKGDGTFAPAVTYPTGASNASSVAIGDFNGDTKLDLAITNYSSNNASVLLNSGNGTFGGAINYPTGASPVFVVASDFSGDGKTDLAVANEGSDNVTVLVNKGDGTFAAGVNYATSSTPRYIAAGNLNADDKPDLVVANANGPNVSVRLNVGNAVFGAAVNYTTATSSSIPQAVLLADLNGDTKLDLAVGNFYDDVSIFINAGDGTFPAPIGHSFLPPGGAPDTQSITLGDVDGNDKPDLVLANGFGYDRVTILLDACLP